MIAAVAVALTVLLVTLIGLLGRFEGPADKISILVLAALPPVGICAAYTLTAGLTLTTAAVSAGSILIGTALATWWEPARLNAAARRPVANLFALTLPQLATLGIVGFFLSWIGVTVAALSTLNQTAVTFTLLVAAGVSAYFGRGRKGLAVTSLTILIVIAVLIVVGGIVGGSIPGLADPGLSIAPTEPIPVLLYALAVIATTAASPQLRATAVDRRGFVLVAGLVVSLLTFATLVGVLLLVGGALQVPSVPASTLVAFVPASVAAIICGLVSFVGIASAGQILRKDPPMLWGPLARADSSQHSWYPRALATCLGSAIVAVFALPALSPVVWVPVLAVTAAVGWFLQRLSDDSVPADSAQAIDPAKEHSQTV